MKGKGDDTFEWNSECKGIFQELKKQLFQALALALSDLATSFDIYIQERRGIALRALAQKLGLLTQMMAYFSEKLDQTTNGWPPFLQAGAATTTLLKEAEKLTFGQPVTV